MNANALSPDSAAGYGNLVLYRMCADWPKHTDPEIIHAKLWLIGRAYSAPLERGAGGKPNFLQEASRKLAKMDIDGLIDEVKGIKYLDQKNLRRVLCVHDRFNKKLLAVSPRESRVKNRCSLSSKYLHFHQPDAFFLFDSVVEKNVRATLEKLNVRRSELRLPSDSPDNRYSAYCIRALRYRDLVMPNSTPRAVDRALYPY